METHETLKPQSKVIIMWCEPRVKGEQEIKFSAKLEHEVKEGDRLSVGTTDNPMYYYISKIKDRRPSTLSNWDYVTAMATRKK